MAQSYTIPESVAALTVHVSQSTAQASVPELGKVTGLTLDFYQINQADVLYQSTATFYGASGILDAHRLINRGGWKLLTFNGFNFGFRALVNHVNVAPYIPRTIDVFYGPWQMINADALIKTGNPVTKRGQMEFTNLLLENLPDHTPRVDAKGQDLTLLWKQILRRNRIRVAGVDYKLTKRTGLGLIGAKPQFPDCQSWATQINETGSVLGRKARGHDGRRASVFDRRYESYRRPGA